MLILDRAETRITMQTGIELISPVSAQMHTM